MSKTSEQPLHQGEGPQGEGNGKEEGDCQREGPKGEGSQEEGRQGEDDRAITELEYLEGWLHFLSELVPTDDPVAMTVVIQTEQNRERLEYLRRLYNPAANEADYKPILKSWWEWSVIYPIRHEATKPQPDFNFWKNGQLDEEAYRVILERRNIKRN